MDGPLSQIVGLAIWLFFVSLPPFGLLFTVLVALALMRAAAFIASRAPEERVPAAHAEPQRALPADERAAPQTGAHTD